jgi:geranylgeranyl pyrophosphate synthase
MEGEFKTYIEKERKKINKIIEQYFKNVIISEEEPSLRRFLRYSEDYILQGGRRLHPITLLETFKGLAPEKILKDYDNEIYDISISIELMHISSLIIDDLIDQEKYRRGKKTFHRYVSEHDPGAEEKLEAFQTSSAIYGGNLNSLMASQIISDSNFNADQKAKALDVYLKGLAGVNRGHLLDEYFKYQVPLDQITLENYLILADKRAKQMETAVGLGAVCGNARKSQMEPLKSAMNKIGVIAQMQNDYKGTFGDPKLQSVDSDIKSGQATILTVLAYQQGTEKQKSYLDNIIGNHSVSSEDIDHVKKIYHDTGAVNFIKMYSNSLKNDIYNSLNSIYPGLRASSMRYFRDLLNYLTDFGE